MIVETSEVVYSHGISRLQAVPEGTVDGHHEGVPVGDWTEWNQGYTPEEINAILIDFAGQYGIDELERGIEGLIGMVRSSSVEDVTRLFYSRGIRSKDLVSVLSVINMTAGSSSVEAIRRRVSALIGTYLAPSSDGSITYINLGCGIGVGELDIQKPNGDMVPGVYSTLRSMDTIGDAPLNLVLVEGNLISLVTAGLNMFEIAESNRDENINLEMHWGALPDVLDKVQIPQGAWITADKVLLYLPDKLRQMILDRLANSEMGYFCEAGQMNRFHSILHFFGYPFKPESWNRHLLTRHLFIPLLGVALEWGLLDTEEKRGRLRHLLKVQKLHDGNHRSDEVVDLSYEKAGLVKVGDRRKEDVYEDSEVWKNIGRFGELLLRLGVNYFRFGSSRTVNIMLTRRDVVGII